MAIERINEIEHDNPWFPLKGPPRNEEESAILKEAIEKEQALMRDSLNLKAKQEYEIQKAMQIAARSNCADLEWEWRKCMKSFTQERFMTMCSTAHESLQECIAIQQRNMERLKFRADFGNKERLEYISDQADRMYLQEIEAKKRNT
jgi:hypothetical protein